LSSSKRRIEGRLALPVRWPLIPTLLVAAAVATMIALGIWQLGRWREKNEMIAALERNIGLPPMALPTMGPLDERLLFRRASAFCLEVTGWRRLGGRTASGQPGTRHIAQCRTGAEGPGFAADMGVTLDPRARPRWRGGEVTGTIVAEPSRAGLVDRLLGRDGPARPMLVSLQPASGLQPSAQPRPDNIRNNSLAYAGQWFFFALAAAVIYVLALRKRSSSQRRLGPQGE
jgi:surfeit locus 1 family protein